MHELFRCPRFGFGFEPDILGVTFLEERRIVIDEFLDPEQNPSMERRYRFTLAHEVGHWRLHRHLFSSDPAQVSLFNEPAPPSVVCRSGQAKAPVEWQADYYASCLLIPRKLVKAVWDEAFPDGKPRVLKSATPFNGFVEFNRETFVTPLRVETETDDQALDRFAEPSRGNFSFRRSLCASGWRNSACTFARSRFNATLPVVRSPPFLRSV
jgi:hypothetical protein